MIKNKWKNYNDRPVLNANIWKDLIRCVRNIRKRVEFNWVKSHSKDRHNKAVDALAKKSAKSALGDPFTVVTVRRKSTDKSVEIGSVKMQCQRLNVHIITSEYLKIQKINKYKYEVVSKGSKYYRNVDIIFSKESMKAGHCYNVTVNKNTNNPMIIRMLKEIDCKTGEVINA